MTEPRPGDPVSEPRRPGPIGGEMAAVLHGLARRARLDGLVQRHDSTLVLGVFAFLNGLISIGLMSAAALATGYLTAAQFDAWVKPEEMVGRSS